jgi:peptide-methionine (R)-S-oxide reductase
MARATSSTSLVITLVGGLIVLCGGIVVMMEYAKVQIKEHDQQAHAKAPVNPYAARIEALYRKEKAVTQTSENDLSNNGRYVETMEPGLYKDIVSFEVLFSSRDKLPSIEGFAEFSAPVDPALLVEVPETVDGDSRQRVASKKANTRLGWKRADEKGQVRYFLNSSALRFVPATDLEKEGLGNLRYLLAPSPPPKDETK